MSMFVRRVQDHSADGYTAIGIDLTDTDLVEGDEVVVLRADALPTKAQIDRMVDALPNHPDEGWHGCVQMEPNGEPVGREEIRRGLYRAAGIEVTNAPT